MYLQYVHESCAWAENCPLAVWLLRMMTIEQFLKVSVHILPNTLSKWDCTDLMVSVRSYFSVLYSNVCICCLLNFFRSGKAERWLYERGKGLGKTWLLFSTLLNSMWFWTNHCNSLYMFSFLVKWHYQSQFTNTPYGTPRPQHWALKLSLLFSLAHGDAQPC